MNDTKAIESAMLDLASMHNILLIDDDEKLAELLTRYFAQHGFSLSHAGAPSRGFKMLESQSYALIILDVMLPEMDGFEVCRRLRKAYSLPIIMLTARGDVTDRIVGLELGADDYLPKPFEPRELVARINSILKRSGARGSAADVLQFGVLCVDTRKLEATIHGKPMQLSHLEYRLLELLARRVGDTLSRDEILSILKGTDADLFTRSVDVLVSRLRQKPKPADPIVTVRGAGYRFTGVIE